MYHGCLETFDKSVRVRVYKDSILVSFISMCVIGKEKKWAAGTLSNSVNLMVYY